MRSRTSPDMFPLRPRKPFCLLTVFNLMLPEGRSMLSRIVFISVIATLAVGCASPQDKLDDRTCRSYGAKKGSEPYIACRTEQARMRNDRVIAGVEQPGSQ